MQVDHLKLPKFVEANQEMGGGGEQMLIDFESFPHLK